MGILESDMSLLDMVKELVQEAIDNGSGDNISVCIVSSQEQSEIREDKELILD